MSTQAYVQKASPIGEDGVVRCYTHNLEAAHRISRTAANPERAFFCCAKDMDDKSRCKFFVWADDPMFRSRENPPPPTNTSVESPSTPRPSQRQRADQARQSSSPTKGGHTPATPGSQSPSTPSQRRLAMIQEAISPSPAKQTRLENIKAGLSQRTQSPTQSQSPMPPSTGVSTSPRKGNKPANIQGGPAVSSSPPQPSGPSQSQILPTTAPLVSRTTPPSENDTDVFYTPPPSQGSQSIRPSQPSSYHLPAPPDARSPKRVKLTHSPDSGSDGGIANGMGLLTPPQSSQKHSGVDGMSSDDTEPQTPTRDKGKGRDIRGGPHLSQGFSIGTNSAPTTMLVPSADALIATMEETLTTLRAVMEKNERKRIAAEKSNDAKAKRIKELEQKIAESEAKQEKESQGWKTKVRVLEETIGALKMRRPGLT